MKKKRTIRTLFIFSLMLCVTLSTLAQSNITIDEKSLYKNDTCKILNNIKSLAFQKDSLRNQISFHLKDKKKKRKNIIEREVNILKNKIDAIETALISEEFKYASIDTNSLLAIEKMRFRFVRPEGIHYYDTIISLFNKMSINAKKSEVGINLTRLIENYSKSKIECSAPSINSMDTNKIACTYKDYSSSKYTLIDFWASWCVPCVDDFPKLKLIKSKYTDDEFKIIGVSIDSDYTIWKKAITKYNINNWVHFLDLNNDGLTSTRKEYFVNGIPVKVLVDNKGKIVARWRGGGDENINDLESILKSLLD